MSGSAWGSDLDRSTPTGRHYSAGQGSVRQTLDGPRHQCREGAASSPTIRRWRGGAVLAFYAAHPCGDEAVPAGVGADAETLTGAFWGIRFIMRRLLRPSLLLS